MADKKLLEESTIRRFMQLANINSNQADLLSEGTKSPVTGGSGQVSKGNKRFSAGEGKHLVKKNRHSVKEAYQETEGMDGMTEEEDMTAGADMGGGDMGGEMSAPDMGGDDLGGDSDMGGGDTKTKVEDAVESLKNALNDILDAVGSDKQVEDEPGEEDAGEEDSSGEEDNMGAEDAGDETEEEPAPIQEKKAKDKKMPAFLKKGAEKKSSKKDEDDELDESIHVIDDEMIEEILSRVTARLVREAQSGAGGSKSHKPKGSTYKPHGAGLGKAKPFSGSGKTLGHSGKHKVKK